MQIQRHARRQLAPRKQQMRPPQAALKPSLQRTLLHDVWLHDLDRQIQLTGYCAAQDSKTMQRKARSTAAFDAASPEASRMVSRTLSGCK